MGPPPSPPYLSLSDRFLEWFMFRFRWIFVILFLLPLSVLFDSYFLIRNWVVFRLQSAPKAHDQKVATIQKQVRDWNAGDKKSKMCTARAGWLTMSFRFPIYKKNMTQIHTDRLVDILQIDESAMTVRVEPMVSMGQLTRYLVPLGYTLPIVPELDDLTVGGMINGCGVEASGRKYGMFQHICVSYELVMADGSLVVASKDKTESSETQALFYGVPWSHGTLGFLVAATIRIIPCKPYVKLTYTPTSSLQEMQSKLTEEANCRENEFVEGLQFSLEKGVVMRGRFSDGPPRNGGIVNRIGQWHKRWFYTHVEDIGNENKEHTEFIPIRDYYHRHSRSIFWEIKEIVPFGNNFFFRWLMGWMCPPKIALLKVTTPPALRRLYDRNHVLQDMLIPLEKLTEAIEVFDKEVEIYPLWLCPYNQPSCPGMVRQRSGKNIMYVDLGAYGITTKEGYNPIETTRRLEKYVRSVDGVQMMYADTYMTRSEFWEMFDDSLYEWLRVKYGCKQMMYADTYMTRSEFWEMFDDSLYEWLRVKYGCKQMRLILLIRKGRVAEKNLKERRKKVKTSGPANTSICAPSCLKRIFSQIQKEYKDVGIFALLPVIFMVIVMLALLVLLFLMLLLLAYGTLLFAFDIYIQTLPGPPQVIECPWLPELGHSSFMPNSRKRNTEMHPAYQNLHRLAYAESLPEELKQNVSALCVQYQKEETRYDKAIADADEIVRKAEMARTKAEEAKITWLNSASASVPSELLHYRGAIPGEDEFLWRKLRNYAPSINFNCGIFALLPVIFMVIVMLALLVLLFLMLLLLAYGTLLFAFDIYIQTLPGPPQVIECPWLPELGHSSFMPNSRKRNTEMHPAYQNLHRLAYAESLPEELKQNVSALCVQYQKEETRYDKAIADADEIVRKAEMARTKAEEAKITWLNSASASVPSELLHYRGAIPGEDEFLWRKLRNYAPSINFNWLQERLPMLPLF